jgi:hypothetical protein
MGCLSKIYAKSCRRNVLFNTKNVFLSLLGQRVKLGRRGLRRYKYNNVSVSLSQLQYCPKAGREAQPTTQAPLRLGNPDMGDVFDLAPKPCSVYKSPLAKSPAGDTRSHPRPTAALLSPCPPGLMQTTPHTQGTQHRSARRRILHDTLTAGRRCIQSSTICRR